MDFSDAGLDREGLAWELAELFDDLPVESVNELLMKNVPLETLRFVSAYAGDFAEVNGIGGRAGRQLPNLLLLGYLIRVVEERLIDSPE